MACFAVPMAVAIITTAFRKKFPKKWHVDWLNTMMWGGVVGLAVEHIANQEIVPYPPFLTAMSNPAGTILMLKEMATVGTEITLALICAWIATVVVYENFIAPSTISNSHA